MVFRFCSFLILLSICQVSLADNYELPQAFLKVDEKTYELPSGTSCWGDLCDDVFGTVTAKKIIRIQKHSKVQLELNSELAVKEVIMSAVGSCFYRREKAGWSNKHSVWFWKEQYDEFSEGLEELARIGTIAKNSQEVKIDIPPGEYILNVGTWWLGGDVFYGAFIEVNP